jgi:hypothetical protein
VIVAFLDEHRDEFGVEPICTTLQVAPSTYYAAKRRELAPSARAVRDAVMMQALMVLWVANRKVYGAHKRVVGRAASIAAHRRRQRRGSGADRQRSPTDAPPTHSFPTGSILWITNLGLRAVLVSTRAINRATATRGRR